MATELHSDRRTTRRARSRERTGDDGRRLGTAGHALVVAALALVLGSLLSAPGIHKSAFNKQPGVERDVALAITGPLATVSHALRLDRPRALVQDVVGRSGDDTIDVQIDVPPPVTPARPVERPPATTPGATTETPRPVARKPVKVAFTPKKKLRLWVAGDSLVITPGWAVVRAAGASPVIQAVGGVDGRVATGLERPDVFNWFQEVARQMRKLKPKAVVLSFGANDDHGYMTGLPRGVSVDDFGTPSWTREYRRRVAGLMDTIIRRGGHVVWIGLPITRSPAQTRRFDTINAVVQQEARKREGKASFIDTYTMFASDAGGYAEYLPDARGREQRMRAGDGVHFERAGGELIAREVLKQLNRAYDLTSWRKQATTG